jgi:hypothetical protein
VIILHLEPAVSRPLSLRIFVADGLRIVDKSNWIGKALVFPRALALRQFTVAEMFSVEDQVC